MSAQPSFDFGAARRDAGHADTLSHFVVELIRLTVTEIAERRDEFTSDDVKEALTPSTRASLDAFPNALGAVFKALAVANQIHDTGRMVRTRLPEGRKRRIVVWSRHARQ